jgi:hypothetical protein
LCNTIPLLLEEIEEEDFSYKPLPHKWSKKEILGHLIDSATNNHHRLVRGQFENTPAISYDQNNWNKFSYHQQMRKQQLISFWTVYNKQILHLVKCIPTEALQRTVEAGGQVCTLAFLVKDYVVHLEHHLRQIVVLPQDGSL